MPLYEFTCRACGRRFEHLTRQGQAPHCPGCESRDLEKQLSVFAVGAGSGPGYEAGPAPGPCGACGDPRGPGACSLN